MSPVIAERYGVRSLLVIPLANGPDALGRPLNRCPGPLNGLTLESPWPG